MAEWIYIAAGVYGTFGESIPIESLIEAANETAKTGQVTGTLADALNWVGLSEEEVNSQLSMLIDESLRARLLKDRQRFLLRKQRCYSSIPAGSSGDGRYSGHAGTVCCGPQNKVS